MRALFPAAAFLGACAASSFADVADFDSFQEGHFAIELVDAGIRFANLDRRLSGQTAPAEFVIEDANHMLAQHVGFTPRNALGFGAYSPGLPVTFSRVGSFDVFPARPAARIALHVFEYGHFPGCTINLTMFRNAEVVGELSLPVVEEEGLHHYLLDFDGPTFDRAHFSIGPGEENYIFALVDTVTVDDALCRADWNRSGAADSADFFAFLNDFFAMEADFNADGSTTSQDFFDFLEEFFAGC